MTVINTNISALRSQASLNSNATTQANAMQQLSTGLRINSAKDDAAGLAVSTRMTSDIRGLAVAIRNANDGMSMAQTAEGAMGQVTNMLQRMRELAVQASTGTASAADRKAMQSEVAQLKNEIGNIAKTTNFNGINLLDGSATGLKLQTGTQAGNLMTMSIASVDTKSLGLGTRASLSSINSSTAAVMSSGDLTINGVSIGSALTTDDTASSASKSASAISKAAAINKASAQTGVTATVNNTVAAGAAQTAAALTGTVTINGFTTASISTTTDAGASRQAVVSAINLLSQQTGVVATDSGDTNHGIVLTAADGRNIVTSFTTLTSVVTGLGAAGTTTGSYSLTSNTGADITIGTTSSGTLANSGLTAGTYKANQTSLTSVARTPVTAASTGVLTTGVLTINGAAIAASNSADDTASWSDTTSVSTSKADSAIAIAAAINKSTSATGVTATANANTIVGTTMAAGAIVGTLQINGVAISVATATGTSAADNRTAVAAAVNAVSNQTGFTATDNGAGLTYTGADGRNFTAYSLVATTIAGTAVAAGTVATVFGLAASSPSVGLTAAAAPTTFSTVSLTSDKAFSIDTGSAAITNFNLLGFRTGSYGGGNNGSKIADVDVSTSQGAQNALAAIDSALNSVSTNRSDLGAVQNRLTATVDNLTTYSTNAQAARSQVLDADYSGTTTTLSKSQVIAQAATAMLAQANQSSQLVLSLLK